MILSLKITNDTASLVLKQLGGLRPQELHQAMADEVTVMSKRYLYDYSASHPNRLGGNRSDYWAHAADAAFASASASEAAVNFPTPGMSRALQDVTITPGTRTPGVKYLTLPATAEAYDRRAGSFNDLAVFWGRGGPKGLKKATVKTRTRKTKQGDKGTQYLAPEPGGQVFYWFCKQAFQPQKRELLPSDEQILASASHGAGRFVEDVRDGRIR